MPAARHPRLTDEQRAERRQRDRELAQRAVERLRSSAGWRRWLAVRARSGLARYSLLIWSGLCPRWLLMAA